MCNRSEICCLCALVLFFGTVANFGGSQLDYQAKAATEINVLPTLVQGPGPGEGNVHQQQPVYLSSINLNSPAPLTSAVFDTFLSTIVSISYLEHSLQPHAPPFG